LLLQLNLSLLFTSNLRIAPLVLPGGLTLLTALLFLNLRLSLSFLLLANLFLLYLLLTASIDLTLLYPHLLLGLLLAT